MLRKMVDVETLGLRPGAVILSIGAVEFEPGEGTGEEFYRNINQESAVEAGLHVDASTVDWWEKQSEEAREVLKEGVPLEMALEDFADFYNRDEEIWADSPAFDCQMLHEAYDALGMDVPWEFYQERDYRTLKNLPGSGSGYNEGVEHHALDDARNQARHAAEILAWYQHLVRDAETSRVP